MKNKFKIIVVLLILNALHVLRAQTVPSACDNLDFFQGNFNNWEGFTSVYSPTVTGTNINIPWYYKKGIVPGRHTIMTTSVTDPYTCNNTNTLPPNSKFCARLGNGGINPAGTPPGWTTGDRWQIDVLTYTISVTPTTNLLTYRYAVVLQDPNKDTTVDPHDPPIRPRFIASISDKLTGQLIDPTCGIFAVTVNSVIPGFRDCDLNNVIASGGNPSNPSGTVYKAWTTVGVDLIKFMNKDVILKFETWDCGLGGHFGYAYVTASCDAFVLKTSGCLPGGGVQVSAPDGFSYLWQPSGETTKDIIAYAAAGDSVTVELTSVTGCKTTLSTKIYPTLINAKYSVSDSVICINESINFTDFSTSSNTSNNAAIPIIKWDWRFGDGQTGSGANVSHVYTTAGTYTAHLVIANQTGCVDSITKIITVLPLPIPNFIAMDVCIGQPVIITDASSVQNGQAITNYTWTLTNPNAIINTSTTTHTYSAAGTYPIILDIKTNEGCKNTVSKTVKVWPLPIVNFSGNNVCIRDSTVFKNLSTFGDPADLIANYTWKFGDPSPLSSIINPKHIYQSSGTFTVFLTAVTGKGCTSSNTHTVEVYPAPSTSYIATPICINSPILFTYIPFPNTTITNWNWNFDDNNSTSTLQNPTHIYTVSALFHPTLTVTTNFGCSNKISLPLSIPPAPNIDFNSDKYNGCKPLCINFINLSFSSSDPINSWNWDFGDSNNSTLQTPTHCYPNAGTYTVSLNAETVNGCKGSFVWNSMIHVYPFPIADFLVTPETATIINPEISFTNKSFDNYTNHWTFGDNGIGSNVVNPTYVYKDPGTYTIWLYVATQYGCKDSTKKEVVITPEWSFYIPNAFTPSHTPGINDEFTGYAFNVIEFEMWIYDRWGVNIFYTNDIKRGWNGKVEGHPEICKQDVYVWKVRFKDINGGDHRKIGHVSLIR